MAALNGMVKDAQGQALPNVLISITSNEVSLRDIGAMTNAEGRFLFADLQPATYTVIAVIGDKRVDTEVDLSGADPPNEVVIIIP